jgi:hypothetical protein
LLYVFGCDRCSLLASSREKQIAMKVIERPNASNDQQSLETGIAAYGRQLEENQIRN